MALPVKPVPPRLAPETGAALANNWLSTPACEKSIVAATGRKCGGAAGAAWRTITVWTVDKSRHEPKHDAVGRDEAISLGRCLLADFEQVRSKREKISARLTKPLGYHLGELLASLTYEGLSPNRIELLGASLGAHIASYAAVRYHQLTGRKPMRLTGLDPAGPCFRNLPAEDRFNPEAAHHVDALHTNIDGFGIADAVAQIDFYANGGEYQQSMAHGFILPCLTLCSHIRAGLYWAAALNNPDRFLAVRCDSVERARRGDCYEGHLEINVLGLNTDFSRPGIYYLPTNEGDPYHLSEEALRRRPYGSNAYLLKAAPDEDLVV
ncbi:unnamed protein product, partial [Iphiclides podalirius]